MGLLKKFGKPHSKPLKLSRLHGDKYRLAHIGEANRGGSKQGPKNDFLVSL